MATAEQIKALIRSHYDGDSERFSTIALQVAAHEARRGHSGLANSIKTIVDEERSARRLRVIPFPQDLSGLVLPENPSTPKSALVTTSRLDGRIERIIIEYRNRNKLKSYGLDHRRKILLVGPPGTGKTMTARVLAKELSLPLYTIQVDRLVTKYMGETSAKLRQIFDLIETDLGVYLFDEFDAIGGGRALDNDVGEMRRVVSSLLQFIEQDTSDSLIVAATNNPKLLDRALFRRFDDILIYELPGEEERKRLTMNVLGTFLAQGFGWKRVLEQSSGLSHSEIDQACKDAIKNAILADRNHVTATQLIETIAERNIIDSLWE